MAKAYYKLNKGVSNFWDPTQPEGCLQKIVGDQVVELTLNAAVTKAKAAMRIIEVPETEYVAYTASLQVEKKADVEEFKGQIAEIGKKATEEALKIVEEANVEAAKIIEEAKAEAERQGKAIVDQATKDAEKILIDINKKKNGQQ